MQVAPIPTLWMAAASKRRIFLNPAWYLYTDSIHTALTSLAAQATERQWLKSTKRAASFKSRQGRSNVQTETPTIKNTHGDWCTVTVHLWENMRPSRREVFFVNTMERAERCDLHSVDNCALPPPSPCIRRCQRSLNPHGSDTCPKWYFFYNNWNM